MKYWKYFWHFCNILCYVGSLYKLLECVRCNATWIRTSLSSFYSGCTYEIEIENWTYHSWSRWQTRATYFLFTRYTFRRTHSIRFFANTLRNPSRSDLTISTNLYREWFSIYIEEMLLSPENSWWSTDYLSVLFSLAFSQQYYL